MIETARLILRPWRDAELPIMAAWNADPEVMIHFGGPRSFDQTAERFARVQGWQRDLGFTFWAMERKADGRVIGNCGLKPLTVPWPEPTDIEIGWMVAKDCWRQGYALEAATAALREGLTRGPRVIAMTAATNIASEGVMARLGMVREPGLDFEHPEVPEGSPYRPHIVYAKRA
jgi:RimJ/RimL family protein N-acetyltransferase